MAEKVSQKQQQWEQQKTESVDESPAGARRRSVRKPPEGRGWVYLLPLCDPKETGCGGAVCRRYHSCSGSISQAGACIEPQDDVVNGDDWTGDKHAWRSSGGRGRWRWAGGISVWCGRQSALVREVFSVGAGGVQRLSCSAGVAATWRLAQCGGQRAHCGDGGRFRTRRFRTRHFRVR